MDHPYTSLPGKAFWKTAVAQRSQFDLEDLWDPKFRILPGEPVATFGSCFAQHIGRALVAKGYAWLSTENKPEVLSDANARRFNYGVFSVRTGNIYTTSLLRQWVEWSVGKRDVPSEAWFDGDRVYDPFRPAIEPNGFSSLEEMIRSRQVAIRAFEEVIKQASFFVFTLGLTESWTNREDGYEYPLCPGTLAGEFDASRHVFENQDYQTIRDNLTAAIDCMSEINREIKFILTVSPVPLTATNSGNHVLVATMESKSILRAVAGSIARTHDKVDYFPSYELINSPAIKGIYFQPNQRDINPHGVEFVMAQFFKSQVNKFGHVIENIKRPVTVASSGDDLVCEEELLAAFSRQT